jgi:putative holliday junction resolvase
MNDERHIIEDEARPAIPTQGSLLGIDFGTRRIGLAMSDDRQVFAVPLETWTRTVESVDARHLRQVCEDYRIRGIVVGLALHLSGDESRISHLTREYGDWVARITGLPVTFWDERFSSATADVRLLEAGLTDTRKDSRRDMLAAQAILQSFLDAPDRSAMPIDRR